MHADHFNRNFVAAFAVGLALSLLAEASAGVSLTLSPTETLTVAAAEPANPGPMSGDILIRERGTDTADLESHVSAFLNFDLGSLPRFSPAAGDTATFSLEFQDRYNTSQPAGLFVGQVTAGAWSAGSPPLYQWATKSASAPAGPGSQNRDTLVVGNVQTDDFGYYASDITPIIDAWVNGGESNYGLGVYLANSYQGAAFGDPTIEFDITSNVHFDFRSTGNAGLQFLPDDLATGPRSAVVDGLEVTVSAVGLVTDAIRVNTGGIGPHGGGGGNTMQDGESFTFIFDQTVNLQEFLLDGGDNGSGSSPPGGSLLVDLPGLDNDMLIDTRSSDGPFSLGGISLLAGEAITFTAQELEGSSFAASFVSLTVSIPEPSAVVLAVFGLLGIGCFGRRRPSRRGGAS